MKFFEEGSKKDSVSKPARKESSWNQMSRKTQEEQDREDDEYLNSLSYSDLHPYPLDPRAREIIERRNSRHYGYD